MKTAICGDSKDVTPCYQNVIGFSDYPTQTWDPVRRHEPPGAVSAEGRPRTSPWGRESPAPLSCSLTGQGDKLSPGHALQDSPPRQSRRGSQGFPARPVAEARLPPRRSRLPRDASLSGPAISCLPRRSPRAVLPLNPHSGPRRQQRDRPHPEERSEVYGVGWRGRERSPRVLSRTWWPP